MPYRRDLRILAKIMAAAMPPPISNIVLGSGTGVGGTTTSGAGSDSPTNRIRTNTVNKRIIEILQTGTIACLFVSPEVVFCTVDYPSESLLQELDICRSLTAPLIGCLVRSPQTGRAVVPNKTRATAYCPSAKTVSAK
jgi:hypothetical protein